MQVFERVKKEKDSSGVEQLAHTMALATRMHNQVRRPRAPGTLEMRCCF